MKNSLRQHLLRYLHINGNYRKNLVVFLLLASVPGIIFSILLYVVSKTQMEKELESIHQNHMYNTIDSIEEQFMGLELLIANWAAYANIQDFKDLDVIKDYKSIRGIFDTLISMEGYNPLIGSVELYLDGPNPIVFTKLGYTLLKDEDQIESYNQLLLNSKKLFWNYSSTSFEDGNGNHDKSLSMVHNVDNNLFAPFGSLLVFLDEEKLEDILQSPYEDGSIFLLLENDTWLFANQNQTKPDPLQSAVMKEILESTEGSEPFTYHYDNIKYTVSHNSFSRLGEEWHYVSIAPMTNITAPVVFISKVFIYLCSAVLIIAIILSLFASKKLYSPINKIIRKVSGDIPVQSKNEFEFIETQINHLSAESNDLRNRMKQQLPHLREGFLLQLVQGYLFNYSDEDLQIRMQQFGSKSMDKKYVIVFVQMIGFSKLRGRFSEGDEGLVTFSAVNIAQELVQSSNLEGDIINFHDLSLGILFSFKGETVDDEIDVKITRFSEDLIEYITNICKMNVSIGISRIARSLKSVHSYFEETKSSLSFRNLQEINQIIEIKKMDTLLSSQGNFEYPFDLEKEITHAIRQRDKEDATKHVTAFFQMLADQNVSESMMKQGALKLLGSIFHIVLQSGLIEDFVKDGANLYDELYKLKDPEEISYWFEKKVLIPIITELSQNQNQRLRLIVLKVMDMIEKDYKEDISLDICAEQVSLVPSVLSKVFKEFSGWNFIDYLTHIRLTKAREMLLETDKKIKDIAEGVGYNHSYFNRIFKKHEGITPSEYREMNRRNIV